MMRWSWAQRQLDMAALTMAERAQANAVEALAEGRRHDDDCRHYRETVRQEFADQRRDTSARFDRQDGDRLRMHTENTGRFDRLDNRARRLEIVYYFGMALMTIGGFLSTSAGIRLLALLLR